MTATAALRKGDRITTTGYGRTARWPATVGTATRVTKSRVYVHWDGTSFEDEMLPVEVKKIEEVAA